MNFTPTTKFSYVEGGGGGEGGREGVETEG